MPRRAPSTAAHHRVMTALAELVAKGGVRCGPCGREIGRGEPWFVPNVAGDPARYGMPRHKACR